MTDRKILCRMLHKAGIDYKDSKVHATVMNRKTKQHDAKATNEIEVVLDGWHGASFYFDEQGRLLDISGFDNG